MTLPEWTSVETALPEEYRAVLVRTSEYQCAAYLAGSVWRDLMRHEEVKGVERWQPLV
ncbi:MAG: hypothetical protein SFY81_06580 [Verrucomicrobiota bacterium]|nr:hypothetical protein [Verrucomicrobiota bacterium]